ncbi:MAG: SDR family NAD(P)-dependent oxidoreductase, partial [Myxococcota bacterium]
MSEKNKNSRRDFVKHAGAIAAGAGIALAGLSSQANARQLKKQRAAKQLKGKVALVTGASRNLGRGFAAALAKNGADVVVHYHNARSKSDAEKTARMVRGSGSKAAIVSGDLSKVKNVTRMFDAAFKRFGRVDVVVNNAGAIVKKPVSEVTEADFDRLFGINAKGTFFCMQEAARRISDNGRIINIATSLLGSTTGNYSAYAGSKAPM